MISELPNYRYCKQRCVAIFVFIVIQVFVLTGLIENTIASQKNTPFQPGEKLTYKAKWGFIPAGEACLEVLPFTTVNGVESYHFSLETKTNSYVDIFYKVYEKIDAFADIDMTHSVLYKKLTEGKHPRKVVVDFDWAKKEARYSNFGEAINPIEILPGAFDPLSLFFVIRGYDLRQNMEIKTLVTDGKKCVVGKARVLKREKIKVENKIFDTYMVQPEIKHIGGVFKKSNDAKLKIWFTADERQIPVRIESKVAVGSFLLELVSAENLLKK